MKKSIVKFLNLGEFKKTYSQMHINNKYLSVPSFITIKKINAYIFKFGINTCINV